MKILLSFVLFFFLTHSFEANSVTYHCKDGKGMFMTNEGACPKGWYSIPKSKYPGVKKKNSSLMKVIDAGVGGFIGGGFVFIVLTGIFFIFLFIYNLIRKKNNPDKKKSIKSKLSRAANSSANQVTGGVSEDDLKEIYYNKLKETASKITTEEEEEVYAKVSREFNSEKRKEGLWTKALIKSDGDESKAKIAYMKLRVEQLTSELTEAKEKELEAKEKELKYKEIKQKKLDSLKSKQRYMDGLQKNEIEDTIFVLEEVEIKIFKGKKDNYFWVKKMIPGALSTEFETPFFDSSEEVKNDIVKYYESLFKDSN